MQMWMVRAGRGADKVEEFIEKGVVALGWKFGELPPTTPKEEILRLLARQYPDEKEGTRGVWASQIVRFLSSVAVGDAVATYRPDARTYFVGVVTSPYRWDPQTVPGMAHTRTVTWKYTVSRDRLSVAARNALGSIATLFSISPKVAEEMAAVRAPIAGQPDAPSPQESAPPAKLDDAEGVTELSELRDEIVGKADGFIEDAIGKLDWEDMQELVAGILRAMGYRTRVSPPGADRGVDIMASPDGLGLQEPRIFVEVKHRTSSQMGAKEIRAFLGGRKQGDRCLYVSTGGFSKDALYEAERATVPLMLVNLQTLRQLLVDNYDKLDPEARALVPLKKLYWPLPAQER